ncbi:MAG: hypothetical protein GX348_06800 [Veillonellaceae bacterium]|jgi:hypothetical protein|nr:hypothetical protein [Veillonellaceae bacterium]
MRRLILVLAAAVLILWPNQALAAEFKVNINIVRQNDGATSTEFWYNDRVVWRLTILADGAQPVSTGSQANTTFITPDIVKGLFLLKVQ